MKTKVKIDQDTAETLMAAGVEVECHYYMYVEAVEDSAGRIVTFSKPELSEISGAHKKSFKRTKSLRQKAPPGCIFIVSSQYKNWQQLKKGMGHQTAEYVACVVGHVLSTGDHGATRKEIAEKMIEVYPMIAASKAPYETAATYISKAYQLGLLEVKTEK